MEDNKIDINSLIGFFLIGFIFIGWLWLNPPPSSPIQENIYPETINNDEDYEQSLSILAGAKKEVFEFFDNVKVNEENESLRKNRLELINMLCKTFQNFINFQLLKANNE